MALIRFSPHIIPMFSGHETFPLRQLWLRKAYTQVERFAGEGGKGVFADDAIERFGVGKNMVSAIRHWGLACDVIRTSKDIRGGFEAGEIGTLLFGVKGCDHYLEHDATIWLVHWLLAGRAERSATWYVVFNFIQGQTFTSKDIVALIQEYTAANDIRCSQLTMQRDVEVCLRSYTSVSLRNATEDSAEPLLSELGLISSSSKDTFHFNRGGQYSLSDEVFTFALLDYWERRDLLSGGTQASLSFNAIAHEYGSPGRVFKLDEDSVGDRLSRISEVTSKNLQWTDSAGIRQVSRNSRTSINELKWKILRRAYGK